MKYLSDAFILMEANEVLVEKTVEFVRNSLSSAEAGHDWFHIYRVWKSAILIGSSERADMLVVQLAALLHDIADSKFHGGDEEIGPATARNFLETQNAEAGICEHVEQIIRHVSYKGGHNEAGFDSIELRVVRDADRLDALGAVGIARAFHYGGFKNRKLYDPDVPPQLNMTKEEYKNSTAPTINHFYEKLLLLKDKMHTETGRIMAARRHAFMLEYLDQFYMDWEGSDKPEPGFNTNK